MNIPEGFTPRGDSNEQPLETYDKWVSVILQGAKQDRRLGSRANGLPWKIPDGPMRIIAWRIEP